MTTALTYLETKIPQNIKNLVIFIHGYGSSGQDLISLAPYFQKNYPNYHFISPNAPYPLGGMENSYFWFPINDFNEQHLQEGIDNAITILDRFIKSLIEKHQIKYEQIILCSFSQGTLLSLHYALSSANKLKAVIGFSGGALPSLSNDINNDTPICLIHGADDTVLPASYSLDTANMLKQRNHNFKIKIIPQLEHSINIEGLEFATEFLTKLSNNE